MSACLLAFNDEATIGRAVDSIRAHVDEVVVYDTGSSDRTVPVVERIAAGDGSVRVVGAGSELAPFLYPDGHLRNFSAARELSFALASPEADWLLWLDADDEAVVGGSLREVASSAPADVRGFVVHYEWRDELDQWRARLVRRDAFVWQGAVHESLVAPGGVPDVEGLRPLFPSVFRVVHHGASGHDEWQTRILLDLEAAAVAAGVEPDPLTLYLLGCLAEDRVSSLDYLARSALACDPLTSGFALCRIGEMLRDGRLGDGDSVRLAGLLDGLADNLWGLPGPGRAVGL